MEKEKEKDGKRRRSISEKDRVPEKRKRPSSDEDDDILALALPLSSKRKNSALPSQSPLATDTVTNGVNTKASPVPHSAKNDITTEISATQPAPVRISLKGKEKESAPSSAHTFSKPKKSTAVQTTPINERKCRDVLKALLKLPEAGIFSRPVDPELDGCPTYYEEITEPMDFGTMSQNLTQGSYSYMEEFAKDMDLVFRNCRKFNPSLTYPVTCADVVEKAFKKEWVKAVEKKLSFAEKRSLQGLMTTLGKEEVSWIFREPVDPIALNIPSYFEVISRKDARDLGTIRQKLDSDKYESVSAFEADIDLMVRNAITFNGAESDVGTITIALRNRVTELMDVKTGSAKKRKEGDKGTPQPTKKVKLGV